MLIKNNKDNNTNIVIVVVTLGNDIIQMTIIMITKITLITRILLITIVINPKSWY